MVRSFTYVNFDLMITPNGGQEHTARVVNSPAGEATRTVDLGPLTATLDQLHISGPLYQDAAQRIGSELYEAVFAGEIATTFERSRDQVTRVGDRLRVRLRLSESPAAAVLPWEYAYRRDQERWIFLSNETPLVRYPDMPQPVGALEVDPPLRILAVISAPDGLPKLSTDQEWEIIREATEGIEPAGRVELHRLIPPTLDKLQTTLIEPTDHHIVHFVGHGNKDEDGSGSMVFEDSIGRPHHVSGQQLGAILTDHRSLRMVVLNACQGAAASDASSLSSAAELLIAQGIPAVAAMQYPISDKGALVFAKQFYQSVTGGLPVDTAMAEARKAMWGASGTEVQFGTPVLYLRADDGRIFDVPTVDSSAQALADLPNRGLSEGEWEILMSRLRNRELAPLIGWHASLPAIPTRQDIADKWVEKYGYPIEDSGDLPKVAQYVSVVRDRKLARSDVVQQLHGVGMDAFDGAPNAYEALAGLPIPVFLTTNFDDLIFDALRRAGKDPVREICPWRERSGKLAAINAAATEPTVDTPIVYHLYGHISRPDSLVLTEDDYYDYVVTLNREEAVLRPRIVDSLAGNSLALLGYRIEDWAFRVLVRGLVSASSAQRGFSVAVQIPKMEGTHPNTEYVPQFIEALFKAGDGNKLGVYWGEPAEFAEELAMRWEAESSG